MARTLKPLDSAKLDRAYAAWKTGRWSLSMAARFVGCDRDALRLRWPEFEQWAERKRMKTKVGYRT